MQYSLLSYKENIPQIALKYCLLLCFLCQFLLQTFSLPTETPRAALERLLHIDIAGASLTREHMQEINAHHTHHHHDNTCTLCPILSHFIFLHAFKEYYIYFLKYPQKILFLILPPSQAPPNYHDHYPQTRAPPQTDRSLFLIMFFQVENLCLHISNGAFYGV